ncbi:MAG TPA: glycosyltransferase family 39 protein [Alphaproteobacteria bacterium]|nr:glycosyltransferase family 39 protein [Alphaproteobacteria bacterium]
MTDIAEPSPIEPSVSKARAAWIVRSPIAYLLILLFALALFLPGLRTLPAVDRDEARFAQASRQMIESGDYVDIHLQDEARLKKPVGIYWLQAAATMLAGGERQNNPVWTYRLPSLLGALGAVLVTLAIGRRWLGAEAGFIGAALLAATLLLGFEARQAKTDAVLLLTVLLAMMPLAEAWVPDSEYALALPRRQWALFWVALGVGILIKGPIVVMVAGLTALVLAVYDRGTGWLMRLRPWPGVVITAAIALPWLIAIMVSSHGAFLTQSLGHDMAAKLTGGQESHGGPPGTYLALFPVTFWPSSLFALLALPWVWRNRGDRGVILALAWVVPSWIVFEAVPTKLPHYVLPLYPAIALLSGAALADRLAQPAITDWRRLATRAAIGLWALIGFVLGIAIIAAAPLGDGRLSIRGLGAGALLWALTAAGAHFAWQGERGKAALLALPMAILAWGMTFGAALPALDAPWIAPRLAEALYRKMPAGHGPVLIAGYGEPSAVIAFGTDVRFGTGADAAKLLADTPDGIAIVGSDQTEAFKVAIDEAHIALQQLDTVAGFNYAKGKRISLTLYHRGP